MSDPDEFVRQTDDLLVIDEVQRVPGLVRALKDAVEEDRRPGRYLITGSANLLQVSGTHESLAGRAETVVLHGLSQGELTGHREDFIDRVLDGDTGSLGARTGIMSRQDYLERVCVGSYPEPLSREGRRRKAWFANYVERVVTRDAVDISRLQHLDRLPELVKLLAANTSGELVKVRLAKAFRIPETIISSYLTLLESLYLIQLLPAWGHNLSGRVLGRPKVALLDTGLAAHLNNLTPDAMAPGVASEAAGNLLESFVAGELRRQSTWSQASVRLFHFRDEKGREVDIVLERDDRVVAGLEVKAAGSVSSRDFRGLVHLRDKLGDRFALGVVLHTGKDAVPFGDRLLALPCSALWT